MHPNKDYSQIKSVIWCPGTGQSGFNSLGRILNGEVNPSAKTSDTFVRDLTKTPTYNNFGFFEYDNMDELAVEEGLINYEESVQYPFGYGLSYTQFEQKMSDLKVNDGTISVDVTVTNTGDVAGKDVAGIWISGCGPYDP